jgi:MOSC domain-containing protein YiiM
VGRIEGITLVKDSAGAIERVDAVRAEAGEGLDGDYHGDLTLISAEELEGLPVAGHETRRNLLTTGIDLNALVGRRFTVGSDVEAIGVELAEPCTKLRRLTGHKSIIRDLVHRAGLRADILRGGQIRIGDSIEAR